MSEKLYRIKLVWQPIRENGWQSKYMGFDFTFTVGSSDGPYPWFSHVHGIPETGHATEAEAKEFCQQVFEQRLISAGVVEEVERAGTN